MMSALLSPSPKPTCRRVRVWLCWWERSTLHLGGLSVPSFMSEEQVKDESPLENKGAVEIACPQLKTIVDLLSEIELQDSIAERFEPQLSKITQRMLRLHFSVERAIATTVKRAERAGRKAERKANRRTKLAEMMAKIQLEMEKLDAAEEAAENEQDSDGV